MKKIILSLVVIASSLTACKQEKKEQLVKKEEVKTEVKKEVAVQSNGNVFVDSSVITWKGTKPTGSHNGTISLKSGELILEEGKIKSGEFIIDMSTIKVLDIPADKPGNGNLVGHLSNKDFFDVEKYPESKFVITSVNEVEGKLNVVGNLTIKDVTKSITIPAQIIETMSLVNFKSEVFKINRADFNVKYGSKSFFDNLKDKFIDDLIEISFDVKVKK